MADIDWTELALQRVKTPEEDAKEEAEWLEEEGEDMLPLRKILGERTFPLLLPVLFEKAFGQVHSGPASPSKGGQERKPGFQPSRHLGRYLVCQSTAL